MPEKSKYGSKHRSKHKSKKHRKRSDNYDFDIDEVDHHEPEYEEEYNEPEEELQISRKSKERLKAKIIEWMNEDDVIAELNAKLKKHKDLKKQREQKIIEMITKMGMGESKIDITEGNNLRGRVYRHKHITKGPLKEDIIKSALMEAMRDQRRVEQLIKKIDSKRPINERYYLKRTKGNAE